MSSSSLSIPYPRGSLGHHRWFCKQFSPFFSVLPCPLGLAELQACPFPDVVFLPLPLSALSSSPFHCALQDGFGQTWWTGNMTIPLQFASLYDRHEVFVRSSCLLDLGTDVLFGNMVFLLAVWYPAVAPHFHGLYSSLELYCEGLWFTSIQEGGCDKRAHQLYKYFCHSRLVSTSSMLLSSVLSGRVSQAWNPHQL